MTKDNTKGTRRGLLTTLAAGTAATASLAAPAIAQSQPTVRWRLTSSFPKTLDALLACATTLSERVSAATDGRFQIQFFGPGEIVPALQALDAVQTGTVECAHTASYYYVGKDPAFGFGTAMPFGLNARQQHSWLVQPDAKALLDEFYGRYNVVQIPFGNTGAQMGGWFRKEIATPADLSGLKMRISGLAGRVMQKLGVIPQQLGAGDIYAALERGTIDAAEWVGPFDDEKLGFVKVAPFYYAPGWFEAGPSTNLFVNKAKWDELPKSYQAIVHAAAGEATMVMLTKYDADNAAALKRLIGAGAKLRFFSRDILEASWKAAGEVNAEIAGGNEMFKRMLDNWTGFRRDTSTWFSISETPLDSFIQAAARRG